MFLSSVVRPPGPIVLLVAAALLATAILPFTLTRAEAAGPTHLVISEVVTGGASAGDELIELYNPSASALPLEGLELVYVSASGATVSRRASWAVGAPDVPPGGHLLVANELGVYAAIADAVYGTGMAATGGSVALRIVGASTAIDAVGWGSAASAWMEGTPAPAPAAGSSIERLPGGALGSTQDTDDNVTDFVEREVPEPQNAGSPPTPDPDATPPPDPTPAASPTATPTQLPGATPLPSPTATLPPTSVSIATARAIPDGSEATIEGVALSDSTFSEGGGYLADATGGIAVLLADGSFSRGQRIRMTGIIDDRFAQRTLRSDAAGLEVLGTGSEPAPVASTTGAIGESLEARLVRIGGTIAGAPTTLSGGLAFEIDDGTGSARLLVGTATGIDTSAWGAGTYVEATGIVGQRDSTGTGTAGYRLQPRDPGDVTGVSASPSPTPDLEPSDEPDPSSEPTPGDGVISIAQARAAPKNARVRVSGTVTLPTGILDGSTAVIQDASGAILLRLGDEVGRLARGERIEIDGTRSTKGGMESLRVTAPPSRRGSSPDPTSVTLRTGEAGEAREAQLVVARGAIVAAARRASSGTVSFEIDDGSGPLRVVIGAPLGAAREELVAGAWVEVRGVLGQETTGAQPLRGYRIWPRELGEVRLLAAPTDPTEGGDTGTVDGGSAGGGGSANGTGSVGLGAIDQADLTGLRVGATLVVGPWPELEVAGLLWDGARLVGVAPAASDRIESLLGARRPPLPLELTDLRAAGSLDVPAVPLVALGAEPQALVVGTGPVAPPSTKLPSEGEGPRWVAVIGRIAPASGSTYLEAPGGRIELDRRCPRDERRPSGLVGVTGIGLAEPPRLVVPCGGIVPAPSLLRAIGKAAGPLAPAHAGASLPTDEARPSDGRVPAAALLGLAAVSVLAGAIGRWWLNRIPPDGSEDAAAPAADEEAPEASEQAPRPPALRLVPLPREQGP